MGVLRISLFGGVEVNHPAWPSPVKLTRTVQALLAYLTLGRQRHHSRDELAGTFWGEHPDDRARSCLSTALWRLRRVLEPEGTRRGTYLQTTPAGDVWFDSKSDHSICWTSSTTIGLSESVSDFGTCTSTVSPVSSGITSITNSARRRWPAESGSSP